MYNFYSDPGHGWLAVPIEDVNKLGIVNKISRYSYLNGEMAYLEEDCDFEVFFNAYVNEHGVAPKWKSITLNNNCAVRNYARFPGA